MTMTATEAMAQTAPSRLGTVVGGRRRDTLWRLDWNKVVWLAVLAVLVLFPLAWIVPAAWRLLVRNEEPEPGGSLSRQVLGRDRNRKPTR